MDGAQEHPKPATGATAVVLRRRIGAAGGLPGGPGKAAVDAMRAQGGCCVSWRGPSGRRGGSARPQVIPDVIAISGNLAPDFCLTVRHEGGGEPLMRAAEGEFR